MHPTVNGKNPYALADPEPKGTGASDERRGIWLAPCGMRGKLWEAK